MNRTTLENLKQLSKINNLKPHTLFWLDEKNKWNLWKIRNTYNNEITDEIYQSFVKATDENAEVRTFILERYPLF